MAFDPRITEANLVLEQLDSSDLVSLAADLLEAGSDGPAIRRMAALVLPSGYETDHLLPRVMEEGHLASITPAEACVRLALQLATRLSNKTSTHFNTQRNLKDGSWWLSTPTR